MFSRTQQKNPVESPMVTSSPCPSPSVRPPKLLGDKYRIGEELGRGAYGHVYLGLDTRTGEHVAIKALSLERLSADSLASIASEVELLQNLNHKNIVKYLGSLRTPTHLYLVLEYMENGALSSVIKASKFGPFPESLVAVYIQQVLQGLVYLHAQGVVHRDIKGANILTTKEGVVKLADFGVAAKLEELQAAECKNVSPAGTPYWMAPEVVEMKPVTTAADIWSVGCLTIELVTGAPPYFDLQPMSALYNIVQDKHPPLPEDISDGLKEFLLLCFKKDPAARPSALELLQHHWVIFNRRTLKSTWSKTKTSKVKTRPEGLSSVISVVERMLAADSQESSPMGDSQPLSALSEAAALQDESTEPPSEFAERLELQATLKADPTGFRLLEHLASMDDNIEEGACSYLPLIKEDLKQAVDATDKRKETVDLRRQLASMRMTAPPGERSLQAEAAAAASCRALIKYITKDASCRQIFMIDGGISALRELLDSPSERLVAAALELLLCLCSHDRAAAEASCVMGLVPAALRYTSAHYPPDSRMPAAQLSALLAKTSKVTCEMLVACQGIPFILTLFDEGQRTIFELELMQCGVTALWGILQSSQMAHWAVSASAYLRLLAHHGAPQRIAKILPWVLQSHLSLECQDTKSKTMGTRHLRNLSASAVPSSSTQSAAGTTVLTPRSTSATDSIPQYTDDEKENVDQPLETLFQSLLNLFCILTVGDTAVKQKCAHADTLASLYAMNQLPDEQALLLLTAIRRLSVDPGALLGMERAGTVSYLVAKLSAYGAAFKSNARTQKSPLQHVEEILIALQNLCQLSKQRQEQAAGAGIVPQLCMLLTVRQDDVQAIGPPAWRTLAVSLLSTLAHGTSRCRAELWTHSALDVFLNLLSETAMQVVVLDALSFWLDAEPTRVEPQLLDESALQDVANVLPSSEQSRLRENEERLQAILVPFQRLLMRSPRLSVALSTSTSLPGKVLDLLRQPSPAVALPLMDVLKSLYENYPRPKEFIIKHRVVPVLTALANGTVASEQVLVRHQAQNLLDAFQANTVF